MSLDPALHPGRFAPIANFSPFHRFLQAAFFLVYSPLVILYNMVVFGLQIQGRENLKRHPQPACILVSNHSLYLDPAVIIHTLFPHRCYYFALKSHFQHPLGGAMMRLMGGIPVPGVAEMRQAERTTREALERGHCVHFFPEGEMKRLNQEIAPFQNGAFYLALRLGVAVVPVTLAHWPVTLFGRQISRNFIRVRCVVGKPIEPDKGENESIRHAAARLAERAHQSMTEAIISVHPMP